MLNFWGNLFFYSLGFMIGSLFFMLILIVFYPTISIAGSLFLIITSLLMVIISFINFVRGLEN